eukprot:95548_1
MTQAAVEGYLHSIVILKCCFNLDQVQKNDVKIKIKARENVSNLQSILSRIPVKFKFIAGKKDNEWTISIDDGVNIDKKDDEGFDKLLASKQPIITIKIIECVKTKKFKIEYKGSSFEWVPPSTTTENEKEWNDNFEALKSILAKKYQLDSKSIEIEDEDQCSIDCGDDLSAAWNESENVCVLRVAGDAQTDVNVFVDIIIADMPSNDIEDLNKITLTPVSPYDEIEKWKVGSECHIYSKSKNKWVKGTVIKVYNDDEGEWLRVQYEGDNVKDIQRYSEYIRPTQVTPIIQSQNSESKMVEIDENKMTQPDEKAADNTDVAELEVDALISNLDINVDGIEGKLSLLGSSISLFSEQVKLDAIKRLQGMIKVASDGTNDSAAEFQASLREMSKTSQHTPCILRFVKLLGYSVSNASDGLTIEGKPTSRQLVEDVEANFYIFTNSVAQQIYDVYQDLDISIPNQSKVEIHASG